MKLLNSHKLGSLTLKNRVIMEPMCMYSARNHDGVATSFHQAHYTARAVGGVGLIIVEATGVSPEGRISDDCLGLYNLEQEEALKKVVESVHENGGTIAIQLNHAGRKCAAVDGVDTIYAPSALAYNDRYRTPVAASIDDLQRIKNDFVEAAKRADRCGFDALEIHGAHGYLLSQFMSPISNQRDDAYKDGKVYVREVLEAVRAVWPQNKPLLFRISTTDYETNGLNIDESILILDNIKDFIDAVNVSTGGITPNPPQSIYPGYQVGHAIQIKKTLNLPVIACGLLGNFDLAHYLTESDTVDFIGLARPLLKNPNWVLEGAKSRKMDDVIPYQYERGFR